MADEKKPTDSGLGYLKMVRNQQLQEARAEYDQKYEDAVYQMYKYLNSACVFTGEILNATIKMVQAKAKLAADGVNIFAKTPEPEPKAIGNTALVVPKVTAESDLQNRYETPMNADAVGGGGGGAVGIPNLSGNDNAQKCWNFFVKTWGISKNWAAAFLGNIQQESQFDPTSDDGGSGLGGHAGICQWDKADRYPKLMGMYPNNYTTLEAQLAFIQYECTQGSYIDPVGNAIQQGDSYSISQATKLLIDSYEVCVGQAEENRQQYAANAYSTFANT